MPTLRIPDMTCGGCARSVTLALQSVDGGAQLQIDVPNRQVRVESSVDENALLAALREAGFSAQRVTGATR
jgi:copper chaperone